MVSRKAAGHLSSIKEMEEEREETQIGLVLTNAPLTWVRAVSTKLMVTSGSSLY